MPRTYIARQRGKRNYQAYSKEDLGTCLKAVASRKLSIRKAARLHNIPLTTIKNKIEEKHTKSVGGQTIFSDKEEEIFVSRVITMCDWGFPLDKIDLRMMVAAYLTKQKRVVTCFKNNIPGDDWAASFMKRWGLTHRVATNIRRKRAKLAKSELETYFTNIEKEVQGVHASNIWNYDETNLRDDPGSKKAVMKRETKYPERLMDSSKLCYSIMFCGNAEGDMLPPYAVYKSVHLYDTWVRGGPKGARYNRTRTGWFDEITFQDWFSSLVLPKLRKQDGEKVLIRDNLSSHLNSRVIEACKNHNIAFVCLFPNGTHILQLLDVAYFAPVKKAWRALLLDWRKSTSGRKYGTLPKEQFASLLKKLIEKLSEGNGKQNLISGFKACGLHPFNPKEVYAKIPSENTISPSKALDQSLLDTLAEMRSNDDEKVQNRAKKKRFDVQPGKSISENIFFECDDEERDEDIATETEEEMESSDSGTEEETRSKYEAESDFGTTSNESYSPKQKLLKTLLKVHKSLDDSKKGYLYVVYYGQKYYWGKMQLCFADDSDDDVSDVEFSFLRYRGDGYWDFPKRLRL